MEHASNITDLFDKFISLMEKAPKKKQQAAAKTAETDLKKWIKKLEPTQKDLKQQLITHPTAINIRELYNNNKKSIDLKSLANELGLNLKKPTIDHIMIGHFYPRDNLSELEQRLMKQADSDPAARDGKVFIEWRGMLRSCDSEKQIKSNLEELISKEDIGSLRRFAEYMKTKDNRGNRKLPTNASKDDLVKALAAQLWKEKMKDRALEGGH
jgi:hypothetical protein